MLHTKQKQSICTNKLLSFHKCNWRSLTIQFWLLSSPLLFHFPKEERRLTFRQRLLVVFERIFFDSRLIQFIRDEKELVKVFFWNVDNFFTVICNIHSKWHKIWLFCSLQHNYFKQTLQCKKGINFGFQFLFPIHFSLDFHKVQLHAINFSPYSFFGVTKRKGKCSRINLSIWSFSSKPNSFL